MKGYADGSLRRMRMLVDVGKAFLDNPKDGGLDIQGHPKGTSR
jgi:hypothetical protein